MGCFGMPVFKENTREELKQIVIEAPEEQVRKQVQQNWDHLAKPLDGMGQFETLTAQIGAILGTDLLNISKKAVLILCADNGIVEEGISQSGQEVTTAVVEAMGKSESSVCRMAKRVGAVTIPVDIGINHSDSIPGVRNEKIRCGTRNFRKEPAMTEEETVKAIVTGIKLVQECKKAGYTLLATGEMGIGNTTTSSAVAAALLQCDPVTVTGKGAGLTEEGLIRKQQIILEAIQNYHLYEADPFTILRTVGGFDIAGLVGVCVGGALFHLPIVLDGVISMVAALVAERLFPGTKEYLLPSHKGKEPAVELLMKELRMEPVIDGKMALGEGTGAVMLFALLDVVLQLYETGTTFSGMQMTPYKRFT